MGTLINAAAILAGGLIGLFFGKKIPERLRNTIVSGLGLFTLAYGVYIFANTRNILIPLSSLVIGTIIGEVLHIEEGLDGLGERLRRRFASSEQAQGKRSLFVDGFVTTSLLFCIGPMAILGSIQDGLSGNFQMLAIKSILDALAALAFASSLGTGVLFSSVLVLVYQGAITLAARLAGRGFDETVVSEMTAVGGIILAGIAISSLLGIKKIRTGSFLPALFVAVAIVLALQGLKINY
jgi:uncharacterized membrane protein YqgA involved in biofilm formation